MSATNPTSGSSSRVSAFGSGVDENKYLMDGVDFTAPVSGAAWPWPDTDVIEEIEVVSLRASAEFGSSPGAVFNVVTRQGANEFRGDAAYYGMYDALTAKPIRVNAAGELGPDGWGFTRNRYRDVTAHAGGPLWRDHAWIYGGYQFLQDWDNQPGTDPAHPRKFGANRIFWKLTANLTPNLRFMHTYHDDYWVIPSTPTVSEPFETGWTFSGRNPSLTFGRITHVLSPSTFYEAGASGFYSPGDLSEPNNPGVPRRNDIDNDLASGGAPIYDIFRQGRTEAKAKLQHYASGFLNADHDFKIGGSGSVEVWRAPGPRWRPPRGAAALGRAPRRPAAWRTERRRFGPDGRTLTGRPLTLPEVLVMIKPAGGGRRATARRYPCYRHVPGDRSMNPGDNALRDSSGMSQK